MAYGVTMYDCGEGSRLATLDLDKSYLALATLAVGAGDGANVRRSALDGRRWWWLVVAVKVEARC